MGKLFALLLAFGVLLLPALAPAENKPVVTFAGFQPFPDQSSRIFVNVTQRAPVDASKAPQQIVFTLHNANLLVRNNKNPLDLTHFATPAKSARLLQSNDDVQLVIELKRAVEVRHRFSDNADGTTTLQVDLPPPDAAE